MSNILEEVLYLKEENIYIIIEQIENKIPEILSYLLEENTTNQMSNKIQMLNYIEDVFKAIDYNLDIFLPKTSYGQQNLNIFEIIIYEFITNTKSGLNNPNEEDIKIFEEYHEELKSMFSTLLSKISLDKKTYHYIFSFLINYLNEKYNNIETEQKLNSEKISNILELLNIYYQSAQKVDETFNYIYFNNNIRDESKLKYLITIPNKDNLNRKKILTLDDSLNVLLFIKLIKKDFVQNIQPTNNIGLIELNFADESKNISFNIDRGNNLINNTTNESITNLEEDKFINILFRFSLKENFKTEIYIDNKKINFNNDIILINENEKTKIKEKYEIKSINLFNNFIGECSNIIIFKNKKNEGIPKFFLTLQTIEEKKPKTTSMSALFDMSTNKNDGNVAQEMVIKSEYKNGIYNEDLFNELLKSELRDDVDQNVIENALSLKIQDKTPINDIKEFMDKILAIYIPTRFEIPNDLGIKNLLNTPKIILKDSINNLDAIFNRSEIIEEENETISNLNGLHLFKNLFDDLSIIGGLNHFIPIIELMKSSEELLTNENINKFFNLITLIFTPYFRKILKDENNSNFFFNLSYFIQEIPDTFYNSELAGNLVNLSQILLSFSSDDNLFELNKQYQNYFLFNEKLLFKFKYPEQKIILEQMKSVLTNIYSNKKLGYFDIDIMKIINILLYYDKDKFNKFCCKNHSEFFNTKSEVMSPELPELIKPLEDMLNIFFKKYNDEASLIMKDKSNIELTKNGTALISLFELQTMGISPCLQKSIIKLFTDFFTENINQAYKYTNLIDKDGRIFDVCLFVFKSSIFDIKIDILNLMYLFLKIKNNLSKNNNIKNKNEKEIMPSINFSGLKEIFMYNYLIPYYLLPNDELQNIQTDKIKKQFYVSGIQYNYLDKTELENKIFSNYEKEKINILLLELYNITYKSFKETESSQLYLNFLVKIASKGNISLIITFLQDLSKEKNKYNEIYDNQMLLNFILETNFQGYMIKSTNFDQNKFFSRFYINVNENTFKNKIDKINELCNEILINIFKKCIYKLDNLLNWIKYYYELSLNENNKINKVLLNDFIFNILEQVDKIKIKKELSLIDKNEAIYNTQREALYFINILFELITFFKYTPVKKDNDDIIKINEDYNIYDELFSSFNNILLNESKNNKIYEPLKKKFKYYTLLKKIYSFFSPMWNKLIKEENDIYGKYIENKKNINNHISEIELLFYQFDDINELNNDTTKKVVNKGVQIIYILYHYFIILFNYGGDKEDIKETMNEFRQFLTLIIISSCTLSTNIDKKKRKWPTVEQYQKVQLVVKSILYHSFYFFYVNIKKYDEILGTNKNLLEEEKDYYLYIKNILYETFSYLLKIINRIYRQIKKEEEKLRSSKRGIIKDMFKKVKGLFSESEGVKSSGPYFLMEKFYSNIFLETNSESKNYLDNIPHIDFKTKDIKNKSINSKIEECIKSFLKETKLKNFFEFINMPTKEEEELNKNKLYPFIEYIKKRNLSLNTFIPCYNNLPNIENDLDNEKNYVIKKLCLASDYFPECVFDKTLEKNISEINNVLNYKILLFIKERDVQERKEIYEYIKVKKRLFSFLGIWSNEEFFYNKDKYELKYKLVNHLSEDFTRVLFKPILNIDYYLPEFSRFNYDKLFRKSENKFPIYYSTDLSFYVKEHKEPLLKDEDEEEEEEKKVEEIKKEEEKEKDNKIINEAENNYNILYDIKLKDYKNLENIIINKEILEEDTTNKLYVDFLKQKFPSNSEACLIKNAFHITGLFLNNQKGIGFYSYKRVHKENDEDFDLEREACYGSIFKPQNKKYDYYRIDIPYNSIEFILKRRYFYKKTCLEIFTVNKKSYLFKLEDTKIRTILDNIKQNMKSNIEDIYIEYSKYDDKIGFYNKQTFVNLNRGFIPMPAKQKEMNLKNIYEKWYKWKLSSLRMLMMINLYANRSYNDLNQYPVFPWIITDYSSQKLNLLENNENNKDNKLIRPFDTPMAMLEITDKSKERKESYLQSWKSSEEDEVKEENYDRYRSHYSTSLYTTYYLVRIFPYSSLRIEIQGKNFDDPNRLFNSLPVSFDNAISQKADLRELIPELFYLPELFYNYNNLNLGDIVDKNENSFPVGDISLPPWASKDGYNFINKHRELLESPEISEKINEWLNIIFGSRQKGKEAKKINNLFISQSYEEEFEEEYKKGDLEKKTYYCKLVEFGVTPNQIFKNDAYKRILYNDLKNKRQLLPNMTEYLKKMYNPKENDIDIAKELIIEETGFHIFGIPYKLEYSEISKDKSRIYAITHEKIKVFKRISEKIQIKKTVQMPALGGNNTNINNNDNKEQNEIKEDILKINLEQKREIKLCSPRYRIEYNQSPIIFYNSGKNVALGGYWNGHILVQNLEENDDKKTKIKNTTIHPTNEYSPIVQMVIDNSNAFVICGNTLGSIYIFIINQNNKSEWTLYNKLHDHQSEITSIAINENLNMFISFSKDGFCMINTLPNCHQINSFRLTDKIFGENNNKIYYPNIAIISDSPLPVIILYIELRQSLCVYSINGHFIKEQKIDFKISSNGIKKFTDMQFKDYLLIFNPNKNCIDIYNIIDLKSVLSLPFIGHTFVDFILSKDLDHILILVKYKGKNEEKNNEQISLKTTYKVLVIRNPNCEIEWK